MSVQSANLDAAKFSAVSMFVSSEETRYYLRGVYVTPVVGGGVEMVATDAHRLLAAYDPEGSIDSPQIVKPWDKKMGAKWGKCSRISIKDGIAQSETPKGETLLGKVETIDADSFPDWKRIVGMGRIPGSVEEGVLPKDTTLDINYLKSFADAAKILGVKYPEIIPRGQEPIHIIINNDVFGFLMPVRVKNQIKGDPVADCLNRETAEKDGGFS